MLPNKEPVWLNMTFPLPFAVAMQLVNLILLVEFLATQQLGHDVPQFLHRQAALLAEFQVLLALAGDMQFVLCQPSISFIRSFRLSYL